MGNGILIYFCLLIPIIGMIFCSVKFGTKLTIWERILIIGIPLLTVIGIKYTSMYSQTHDTEYWNAHLISATYYEYWSTWDDQTCTRTVSCGKDCRRTETYDCSHCDDYPEEYVAQDNLGRSHLISKQMFEDLCKLWGNKSFVEMNRDIDTHWGCGQDGDAYTTIYDRKLEHTVPYCDEHTYENKINTSRSLFNFVKVDSSDKKQYGLYDYPKSFSPYNFNPIFGDNNQQASTRLMQYNALMGSWKRVHMMILVFPNKSVQSAYMQESYWKRGNKNEFILCIGTKGKEITWTKCISWTDKEDLKAELARSVLSMPYDLPVIIDTMATQVKAKFVKKNFREFNYITVEPSDGAVLGAFIATLILTIGICIFSVKNDFDLSGRNYSYNRRKRYL